MIAFSRFSFPEPDDENVIEAEAFVLKDKNGNRKAALAIDSSGSPYLLLKTDAGACFAVYTQPDGSIMVFTFQGDKPGFELHSNEMGATVLIRSAEGKVNVTMTSEAGNSGPHIRVEDDLGETLFTTVKDEHGEQDR